MVNREIRLSKIQNNEFTADYKPEIFRDVVITLPLMSLIILIMLQESFGEMLSVFPFF